MILRNNVSTILSMSTKRMKTHQSHVRECFFVCELDNRYTMKRFKWLRQNKNDNNSTGQLNYIFVRE